MLTEFSTHVFLNNEFINLYSEENPILDAGDECYALITNNADYHFPVAIKGIIREDTFTDGMNKKYLIEVTGILESPEMINKFMIAKAFTIFIMDEDTKLRRTINFGPGTDLSKIWFPVNAYFVRNSETKIRELQREYITIVKKEIQQQLKDIENY